MRSGKLRIPEHGRRVTSVTGELAAPYISRLMREAERLFGGLTVDVRAIRNDFFGERITVTGLVTGGDLIRQLKGTELGEELLIPVNMLRRGEEVFLDDVTLRDVKRELGIPVRVVWDSGEDLVRAVIGLAPVKEEDRQYYEQADCSNCGQTECRKINAF